MILINAILACDRCGAAFLGAIDRRDVLMRRDLEALRAKAHAKGWRRFRVKNTGPNGDYCPGCVQALAEAKKGPPS